MAIMQYKEQLPKEVLDRLKNKEDIVVLDVREPEEWEAGHIPGAKHIPLGELTERIKELDPQKEMVVVCRSGNRSAKACDYLSLIGRKVMNMTGGMSKWTGDIKVGK